MISNRYKYLRYGILPFLLCCILCACSKMDDSYRHLKEEGEINYPAKADTIIVYPGLNRVKLAWVLRPDPNIAKCRVYWNNRKDSVEVPVTNAGTKDTISTILENMAEGSYIFTIYTYDAQNNVSVKAEANGTVYGASYVNVLTDRLLVSALKVNGKTRLQWGDPVETSIGAQVRYTDAGGTVHTVFIPSSENISKWEGYPAGDTLQYRTLYKPEANVLDTFSTAYKGVSLQDAVPELLNVSTFRDFILPTDAAPSNGTKVSNLWNGVLEGKLNNVIQWYRTVDGSGIPHWFTFDMGVTSRLTSFVMWQRGTRDEPTLLYANGNPRKWEVWGSNDPAPDGSWTGWTKLGDCESVKPSGLPLGQTTTEDIEHAAAGETSVFPENTPAVRYVRIKILETWAKTNYMFMSEIALYGITE